MVQPAPATKRTFASGRIVCWLASGDLGAELGQSHRNRFYNGHARGTDVRCVTAGVERNKPGPVYARLDRFHPLPVIPPGDSSCCQTGDVRVGPSPAAVGNTRDNAVHPRCRRDDNDGRLRRLDQGSGRGGIGDVPGRGKLGTSNSQKFRRSRTGHLISRRLDLSAKQTDDERPA